MDVTTTSWLIPLAESPFLGIAQYGDFAGYPALHIKMEKIYKGRSVRPNSLYEKIKKVGHTRAVLSGANVMTPEYNVGELIRMFNIGQVKTQVHVKGSDNIKPWLSFHNIGFYIHIIMPSTGDIMKNDLSALYMLKANDSVQFSISSDADYQYARQVLATCKPRGNIFLTPTENFKKLEEYVITDKELQAIYRENNPIRVSYA